MLLHWRGNRHLQKLIFSHFLFILICSQRQTIILIVNQHGPPNPTAAFLLWFIHYFLKKLLFKGQFFRLWIRSLILIVTHLLQAANFIQNQIDLLLIIFIVRFVLNTTFYGSRLLLVSLFCILLLLLKRIFFILICQYLIEFRVNFETFKELVRDFFRLFVFPILGFLNRQAYSLVRFLFLFFFSLALERFQRFVQGIF